MPVSKQHELLNAREYHGIDEVTGPLVILRGIHNVGYNTLVSVTTAGHEERLGVVLESSEGAAVVQVFEGTSGLSLEETNTSSVKDEARPAPRVGVQQLRLAANKG